MQWTSTSQTTNSALYDRVTVRQWAQSSVLRARTAAGPTVLHGAATVAQDSLQVANFVVARIVPR